MPRCPHLMKLYIHDFGVCTKVSEGVGERMEVKDGALRYALFEKRGRRVEFGPPHSYDWNCVKYFMDYF